MKVLIVNGSPHNDGSTAKALAEAAEELRRCGVESELLWLGSDAVSGCTGCGGCARKGRCVKDDAVNRALEAMEHCDGLIVGTPVHFASPSGAIISFMDRFFFAGDSFAHKPGAAVAVARRAGTTASVEVLNKYFTIAQMPVVSSTYWSVAFGSVSDDVAKDAEGLQTMRNLGRNMAWLLKCIEAGKASGVMPPKADRGARTNFIR